MNTIKKVRAPVRIDFGGGTTDISPFKDKYGGAVLNAAINKYIYGELISSQSRVGLKYYGDIPTSSGLGTSGVMNLIWLSLISKTRDRIHLAEQVYGLEQSMGLVGGKQDQYAAALGGINFLEFKKDKVKIQRLNLSKNLIKELEDHLILVYTGKPHFSGHANSKVIENIKKGKNVKNLIEIKNIAIEMRGALLRKDLEAFSRLMNRETQERNQLHKILIPLHTKEIIKHGIRHGAEAAKICGSGNGGCVLFFGNKKRLKDEFKSKVIDFKFDFKGLTFL
jgi:D-glycero-alpha-D-manno-heptose-7-phosphate kinase